MNSQNRFSNSWGQLAVEKNLENQSCDTFFIVEHLCRNCFVHCRNSIKQNSLNFSTIFV